MLRLQIKKKCTIYKHINMLINIFNGIRVTNARLKSLELRLQGKAILTPL